MATDTFNAEEWMQAIDYGIQWREETSGKDDELWTRYANYYGANWEAIDEAYGYDSGFIAANRAFAFVRSAIPNLYFRNPGVTIKGVDEDFALNLQKLNRSLFNKMLVKKHLKRCLLDAMISGVFILKFGYNSRFEVREEGIVPKKRIEYSRGVRPGMPWIGRTLPSNFVLPYGTIDADEAPWCAEYVVRPYHDILADPGYKNKDKLRASYKMKFETKMSNIRALLMANNARYETQRNLVKNHGLSALWHIWNKQTGQLIIIDDATQLELFSGEKPILEWGFPFIFKALNEDVATNWSVSNLKILEPDLLDLCDVKSERRKLRRTMLYRIFVKIGKFFKTQAQLDKFLDSNELRSAFLVDGNPRDNVQEFKSSMPEHLYQEPQMIEHEMNANLRMNRNRTGDYATGRRSATEAHIVDSNNDVSDAEYRDIIAEGIAQLTEGLNNLLFRIWTVEDVRKISGINFPYWPASTDDPKLLGLTYEATGEDLAPEDTRTKRQEADAKYQIRRGDPLFNPYVVAAEHARAWGENPRDVLDPALSTIFQFLMTPEGAAVKENLFKVAQATLLRAEENA